MLLGEHLEVDADAGTAACAECGEGFGSVDENLKTEMVVAERPVEEAGPYFVDPSRFVSDDVAFREYYCPSCGTLTFTETVRVGDDPLSEVELDPETL